jgi:hypothetical protein
MRNTPLKGLLGKSPIKKTYDFSKTKTYSGKGTIGEKLATDYASNFKTTKGAISEIIPLGKAKKVIKLAKGAYNYLTS